MIKHFNGIPVFVPNTISSENKKENYYISYNPSKRDYGVDTTALVITIGDNERRVFYILKGNHEKAFTACKNLKECLQYFLLNKENIHPMGDELEHQHIKMCD